MAKLYYCYERDYPFFVRIIENGQSVRLPLDQYGREFTLNPDHIMLSREEFEKRLARIAAEKEKLNLWNQGE